MAGTTVFRWPAWPARAARRWLVGIALASLAVLGGAWLLRGGVPAPSPDGAGSRSTEMPIAQGRVVPAVPEGAPTAKPSPVPAPAQDVEAGRSEAAPHAAWPRGAQARPVAPPQPVVPAPVPQGKSYGTAPPCPVCGWVESVSFVAGAPGGVPPGALAAAGAARGVQSLGSAAAGDPATVAAAAGLGAAMGAGPAGAAPGRWGKGGSPVAYHEILVRMEDGSQRLLRQTDPLPLGARVWLQGGRWRLLPEPATGVARTAPGPGPGYAVGTR